MAGETDTKKGGCLCGQVRYALRGDPVVVAHCHCRDCQKASGAGHTTAAVYAVDQIESEGDLREFQTVAENGNTVSRLFCGTCGSQVFGRNTGSPNHMSVPAGTLDDPDALTPQVVVFTRSRCSWDIMDTSLPSFETQPDWNPDNGI